MYFHSWISIPKALMDWSHYELRSTYNKLHTVFSDVICVRTHAHLGHNDKLLNDGRSLIWNVIVEDTASNPVAELEEGEGEMVEREEGE